MEQALPTYPGASGALQFVAKRSCQYLLDLKRDQNCLILGSAIIYTLYTIYTIYSLRMIFFLAAAHILVFIFNSDE